MAAGTPSGAPRHPSRRGRISLLQFLRERFHLLGDVIDRVPSLAGKADHVKQWIRDKLTEHGRYIAENGLDMPEVKDWRWPGL